MLVYFMFTDQIIIYKLIPVLDRVPYNVKIYMFQSILYVTMEYYI